MTTEYQMLVWSVALGLVHVIVATTAAIMERGLPWALGPRDKIMPRLEGIKGRLDRSCSNFVETFPFFAAVVLAGGLMGVHNQMTALGATIFFWARLLYVPAYAAGIPVVRTAIWGVSLAGIVMLLVPLF